MISDSAQREAALDPGQSFIVEAPAGSGKTGLLTQRFLRLLSVVERPESIVAMTFTRKAASEMKERIHKALKESAGNFHEIVEDPYQAQLRHLAKAALTRAGQRGWNLLDDSQRLQVQTIDSLCATLTRQMPVISEFGGVNRVVEDASQFYRLAARETVRRLTEGSAGQKALFRRVALHFDNDMSRVERQVADMLQKREQWSGLVGVEGDPLVSDFTELLHLAGSALREVFRSAGTVDFTEVARAARKALGTPESPTDLLYSLDYRIEHLLVDEFQDTSRAQYDLIKALTEQWSDGDNRSLFLVGDPMQSIYRFREAEVGLFLRCWEQKQLGAVRLTQIALTTNFRSTPEIVSWVAKHIGAVMPDENPKIGAVKFRESEASRSKGNPEPTLTTFLDDDGAEEAAEILKVIASAPDAKKIAILVRSRTHVLKILPALRAKGIPYKATEIDLLKDQQHVIDLLSLTRAVLHAADRVSWLACLRAPWCGLTLVDLSALAEDEPESTILNLLSDPARIAGLSPNGRQRAVRLQEIMSNAVEQAGRVPLRVLVEQVWLALGGPAVLRESNHYEDAQTYFDLIESVEEGGVIRDFSLVNTRLEKFYAKPTASETQVEVMTIHGAKGLEFDIVIIPQTARTTRTNDRDLLIWTEETDETGDTYLNIEAQPRKGESSAAYDRIQEEIDKKETEETKRLFYVACTRAMNQLYLFASTKRKKDGAPSKAGSDTFVGLIWNSVGDLFKSDARRRRAAVQQNLFDVASDTKPTLLNRLPVNWRLPKFETSVRWQPELEKAVAAGREITYEWVGDTSRYVGTVVHDLFKRIAAEGVAAWNVDRAKAAAPLVRAELLRLGVPAAEENAATKQALRALCNTLASERGRWLLSPHADAKSEFTLGGRIQDKLIAASIDRTFRDEQGRLWIVDFKNSEHKGGNLEKFLEEERRRYTAQLENYAVLMSRVVAGPIHLGLYFPLLDAWREWRYAADAAVAAKS